MIAALAVAGCATTPPQEGEPAAAVDATPAPAAKPAPPAPAAKPRPPPPPAQAAKPDGAIARDATAGKGADVLATGLKSYEDGDYKNAARQFQTALSLGLTPSEEAKAHKHLAFLACVANRHAACRTEFRKAFAADPGFDLAPAEAGHPMWGPVFRSVKAEAAAKAKRK